jgi:xylulokinase
MSGGSQTRFLGLDLGTSSLKVLATDAYGVALATVSRRYPLMRAQPGWAEQEPHAWWAALVAALDDLRAMGMSLDALDGIGLSGQMHGLLLLDAHGEALGPCQTWADSRCSAEARSFERRVGRARLLRLAGSAVYTSATAPKLLWTQRHEPERLRAAAHLLLPKDELRFRLTGTLATDASDASGTLLCDVAARKWSDELVAIAGVPQGLLPPVLEATDIAGVVSATAARTLGLRAGIPVVAGGGDAAVAGVGQGLLGGAESVGLGLATLGTAGQFFTTVPLPQTCPDGALQTLCHAIPGGWFVMRCILAGGSAMEWLAGLLAPEASEAARGDALRALLAAAEEEPAGARGVLFLPHLNGVRSPAMDAMAAGAFLGLRADTSAGQLARAVIEGVALALREGLDAVQAGGIAIERVRLAGGANRLAPWAAIQASVYNLPVEQSAVGDDASALGAAWLAAAGVGALRLETAAARVAGRGAAPILPDAAAAQTYQRLAPIFRDAQQRLYRIQRALAPR